MLFNASALISVALTLEDALSGNTRAKCDIGLPQFPFHRFPSGSYLSASRKGRMNRRLGSAPNPARGFLVEHVNQYTTRTLNGGGIITEETKDNERKK